MNELENNFENIPVFLYRDHKDIIVVIEVNKLPGYELPKDAELITFKKVIEMISFPCYAWNDVHNYYRSSGSSGDRIYLLPIHLCPGKKISQHAVLLKDTFDLEMFSNKNITMILKNSMNNLEDKNIPVFYYRYNIDKDIIVVIEAYKLQGHELPKDAKLSTFKEFVEKTSFPCYAWNICSCNEIYLLPIHLCPGKKITPYAHLLKNKIDLEEFSKRKTTILQKYVIKS